MERTNASQFNGRYSKLILSAGLVNGDITAKNDPLAVGKIVHKSVEISIYAPQLAEAELAEQSLARIREQDSQFDDYANLLTDATQFIPPAVAALAARTTLSVMASTRSPVNLVISNVPGPQFPLYCAGARLEAHYPVSVIADGVGLNITVMSYLDHLDFGIVADRDQVDDVWTLMDRLARSLDELTEAVLGKAGKRRAKRAAAEKPKVRA